MNKKIALIPLDSRPCNCRFPVKLAKKAIYEVIVPPGEILDFYTRPADTAGILNWLSSAAKDCDSMIVSADMLAYGGLIASRTSKTSVEEAKNNLLVLDKIKKQKPGIKIYLFSIITRLSITAYSDASARIWQKLFDASSLVDNIEDLYRIGDDIPREALDDFVSARKRNHKINRLCIDLAANGTVDFLMLGKEDTSKRGLQAGEIKVLEDHIGSSGCKDKALITNGADEIACVLAARRIIDDMKQKPKVAVRYSSKNKGAAALYEDAPVDQNVREHIGAAGCAVTEKIADADMVLFINMFNERQRDLFFEKPEIKDGTQMHLLKNFCSEIVMAKDISKKTAVADINYVNGGDEEFVSTLKRVFDLTKLDAYAGWNTASNSIGYAIAHAVLPANKELLLERFVDDLGYQAIVRPEINELLEKRGISKYNVGEKQKEVESIIKEQINNWAHLFFANLELETFNLELTLPWPRTFEIDCDIILQ
ncbi:MAG: DUF4127 family protein [Candidatus Margulisiibacteriota bacterium]